jgi:DNA-binding transcriptional ArsR family regulator
MSAELDLVFKALANANRRALLDRLFAENGQSQQALRAGLDMSQQAVAQHLAVLENASLVTAIRHGREKLHYINPVPLQAVADRWVGKLERPRVRALIRLKKRVEERENE